MQLQGGRIKTLPGVLHIPTLARNLISVSKMDDAGVKTVFEKDACNMVQGALVLIQGVRIGTLYKLQGSTIIDGCNSFVVPKSGAESLVVSREKTMLWHQRLGHITWLTDHLHQHWRTRLHMRYGLVRNRLFQI